MSVKFELTKKTNDFLGYKIINEGGGSVGICYGEYRDNEDDVILNISITDNKYLSEIYEFISREIFVHFENIQHVYTEVYKSQNELLDFYQKNDFIIVEDESEQYPKITNPLLLLQLKL